MPRRSDWPDTLTPTALQILLALADENRHGLGIAEEAEARSDGEIVLGPGTLYGTIKRLKKTGLVAEAPEGPDPSGEDPRRRYYAITPSGRAALAREVRRMETLVRVAKAKAALTSAEGR